MRAFFGIGWATPVVNRGWATAAVVLHRLQRLTVHGPAGLHAAFNKRETAAWYKATGQPYDLTNWPIAL